MKRLIALGAAALAVASILFAQAPAQTIVRTPTGDKPVTVLQQSGQTYVAADDVMAALGGTATADNQGFRVSLAGKEAAFGPDSRFAVVRDDLIEMPVPPLTIDGRPFVPWQFFSGFLRITSQMEASWDAAGRVLSIRPIQRDTIGATVSVIDVGEISKVVVQLSATAEYSLRREGDVYIISFRNPLRVPFTEQAYDNAHVASVSFVEREMRIVLRGHDIVGDSYHLDAPFRVIVDLRKGVAPVTAPGALRPGAGPGHQPGVRTIVLDPGHGGKEVGAIGANGLQEKDATLAITRKLADRLQRDLGVRVILTRNDDALISLEQRTMLANQHQADLFLSIHMNAALVKDARGAETYFLSLEASDELARRAAERENASNGSTPTSTADSDLRLILWDLAQQEYLKESSRLAELVQDEMNTMSGIQNRGVKQAPFKVLLGATMPAALVEVGFISNAEEEKKLNDEAFQNQVAETLSRAIGRFKNEYEARIGVAAPAAAAPAAPTTTAAPPGTDRKQGL